MRQARMSWSFMLGLGLLLAACGGGDARGSDGGGGDVGGSPGEGGTNTTAATINGGGAAAETPAGDSAECEQTTVHNGRVACSERIVGGDSSQIFSYAPDGSDRRPLTASGYNIMPSWSWDGARMLFASNIGGGAMEIWTTDADGAHPQQLTFNTPGGNFTPVESPDGSRIAFSSLRREVGHPEVWVMNADGSEPQRLTHTPEVTGQEFVWSLHPTWSPDGQRMAYASTASGSTQIWVTQADGGAPRQITAGLGDEYPYANVPAWSVDGTRITFWAGFERRFGEVWTINPDGTDARRVTETPDHHNSDDPQWSPDGTTIIFCRGLAGDRSMWVVDAAGGDAALFAEGVHWCTWQPVRAS